MAFEKSTIVRSVWPVFRALEVMAPAAGAVIAERLWCTIPRASKGPRLTAVGKTRRRPAAGSAAGFGAASAGTASVRSGASARPAGAASVGPGEIRRLGGIVTEAWGSGPVVYLMHGWGGWRGQFEAFVGPLVASGHRVVALDAPSHGESEPGAFGKGRGLLTEFSAALAETVAAYGPAHAIVAHSLGATGTALAVLDGLDAQRVVLIAPMANPLPYTYEFAQWLGFGERIRSGFIRRIERRVNRQWSDFDIVTRARRAGRLPRLLLVHDERDREVYVRDGEAIAQAWPGAELMTTTGLGHRRILRDPAVVARILDHVTAVRV